MLLFLTITCTSVTILVYALHYWVRGGRKGELIDKIPGPHAWPLIGNIAQLMVVPIEELWDFLRGINKKYYPISRIWGVDYPVALLTSTNHIEKSLLYTFLHPWLGAGLLTSTGAKWHVRRRILTPAFHFNVLRQFVGIFVEQSEKLAQSLCVDGDEVVPDLVSLLHKYTVNLICETAMGSTSDVDENILNEYRSCVSKMGDTILYRLTRPWTYKDWMFKFFKKFQEKDTARAEVDAIFVGKDRSKLSMQEIQSLTYLERCIKESLRLFPSVLFIARMASEDLQLKNYLVPGGTLLHVFILDLHRDPNFWPNPDVFDPDRFLPDQIQGRHPIAFVPFSAAPRNCIGQKFAMIELKTLIGTFLHNFYLHPIDFSSEARILPDLVIRPKDPIRIKLVRRSHDNQ